MPGELFGDGFENNPVTLVLALLHFGAGALAQIVVFFTTVVVFLMWLYRVSRESGGIWSTKKPNAILVSLGGGKLFYPLCQPGNSLSRDQGSLAKERTELRNHVSA